VEYLRLKAAPHTNEEKLMSDRDSNAGEARKSGAPDTPSQVSFFSRMIKGLATTTNRLLFKRHNKQALSGSSALAKKNGLKTYVMGIDFGSTTAKTVILDLDSNLITSSIKSMGAVSADGVQASINEALQQAGLQQKDMGLTVSTGYGRRMLDIADRNYTEITCHARGALSMMPNARLVVDIGGQDSKVIAIDGKGVVTRFAMNDRCAAGTGKFLEVLARAMDIELDDMGALAMQAKQDLKISSMCATFAESEVISLLAEGRTKPDILGAVHASIATRTTGLAGRVGKQGPVVMTGGVANNIAAVHYLEKAFGSKFLLPHTPQIAGALGAALLALEEYRSENQSLISIDKEDQQLEQKMAEGVNFRPLCKTSKAEGQIDKTPAAELIIAEAKRESNVK
jgi:predicted CoA-substrate-specific enzyme activase